MGGSRCNSYIMRFIHFAFVLLFLIQGVQQQQVESLVLEVANKEMLQDQGHAVVFNGSVSRFYNDVVFRTELSCRNDNLEIIDNTHGDSLVLTYRGMPKELVEQMRADVSPNQEPRSFISSVNESHIVIDFNCGGSYTSQNYFNEVTVGLLGQTLFSFLINCDPDSRHKQFQIGYIIISLINASIIVGVAMHSHVWSIRIKLRPLRFQLRWIPFLVFSVIGSVLIILLAKFAMNDSSQFFIIIRYVGVVISTFFVFLCCNEILFLINGLRKQVYKFIRLCDVFSLALTIVATVLAFLYQNWIFYSFIAGCICVGSIKIFHFNSLWQAFSSMLIMATNTTILAIILHYILPQSYNDLAGELSSPLFFQVPDLVNNLYKKCSWLPIIDVIIPGVALSYLRVYDENKSSKWGGLYTVTGNLTFVLATALWIGIQYFYPFSVPFSLITYPILILGIFIVSWRRQEWPTLLHGRFEQGYDTIDEEALKQYRNSFKDHISNDDISQLFIKSDQKSPSNSGIN